MKTCFIFGALKTESLVYFPEKDDLIIAADRGTESLNVLSIKPDLIIGDFDSLGYVPKGENVKVLPVRKDETDVGYAVKYAFSVGYRDFVIYGCIGGALDHTLANLQLGVWISENGGNVRFIGEDIFVTVITNGKISINDKHGRISVFSAGDKAEGVTLKGLEYPLKNAMLKNNFPLGVGNYFKDKNAQISVKKGTLIIMSETVI